MFSKKKMVGGIYKTVIDWDAIGGTLFVLFILSAVIGVAG